MADQMEMRHRIPIPDVEILNACFSYQEASGLLIWKRRSDRPAQWNQENEGLVAGHINQNGYRVVRVRNVAYLSHRVIWKMAHGSDPDHIDHINGIRSDNRLCNLRDVSAAENQKNRSLNKNNTTGVSGVSWCRTTEKFVARISVGGRGKMLGRFLSIEDAVQARRDAEKSLNFSENHGAIRKRY